MVIGFACQIIKHIWILSLLVCSFHLFPNCALTTGLALAGFLLVLHLLISSTSLGFDAHLMPFGKSLWQHHSLLMTCKLSMQERLLLRSVPLRSSWNQHVQHLALLLGQLVHDFLLWIFWGFGVEKMYYVSVILTPLCSMISSSFQFMLAILFSFLDRSGVSLCLGKPHVGERNQGEEWSPVSGKKESANSWCSASAQT